MIAKGLDFPGVTLVGVIMADVSLHMPDFRSIERTYQTLVQVAGRAGRRDAPGKVIIQTYKPDSPVFGAVEKQNFEEFFNWELENRRQLNYPPFSHVINLLFSGENSERVREHSITTSELIRVKAFKNIFGSVLGPAPCPISRIKSRYRWHVVCKGENVQKMTAVIRAALKKHPPPIGVNFTMDVDPMNLM
jgi:primosomal protein N' (replication factor Y) (superfamily II helicase)